MEMGVSKAVDVAVGSRKANTKRIKGKVSLQTVLASAFLLQFSEMNAMTCPTG